MAVDANLELWVALSLRRFLAAAVAPALVQAPGVSDAPAASVEEWYASHLLGISRWPAPKGTWAGGVRLRVSCFSRAAKDRADKDSHRPYAMAALVRTGLDQRFLPVQDWSASPFDPVAYLSLGEADVTYVSEIPGPRGASGLHACLVDYRGFLTTY